jgi:hypothetical protein
MALTRRTFVLSALSLVMLACYQKSSYACGVEQTNRFLKGIAVSVVAAWVYTLVEILSIGTLTTLAFPLAVTIAGVLVAAAIVKKNKDCLSTDISGILGSQ